MRAPEILYIVTAVIGASGLLGWAQWWTNRRISSTDLIVGSATALLEPMRLRIDDLEEHVAELDAKIVKLETERTQMLRHMFDHGLGWPPT